jgi:hypothetical protein
MVGAAATRTTTARTTTTTAAAATTTATAITSRCGIGDVPVTIAGTEPLGAVVVTACHTLLT